MTQEFIHPFAAHEPEKHELTPKVKEILGRHALDYHAARRDELPSFPNGGLTIAAEIVEQAYFDGQKKSGELAQKSGEIDQALSRGFEIRKRLLYRADRVLHSGNSLWDLGISKDEEREASSEFGKKEQQAQFPALQSIIAKTENRVVILPKLAELFITPILSQRGITEQERIQSYIATPVEQSMVIRGALFAGLGRAIGVVVEDPTFLSDEEIDGISSRLKNNDASKLLHAVSEALAARLSSGADQALVESTFEDFGKQVIQLIHTWEDVKKIYNLENDAVEYWKYKNRILKSLPITPFTPGIQYVSNTHEVFGAVATGTAHIFQNGEEMEGHILASLDTLTSTLRFFMDQHIPIEDPEVVRLLKGQQILKGFEKSNAALELKISRLEEQGEALSTYLQENANILEVQTEDDSILAQKEDRLKSNVNRFARTKNSQLHAYALATELESLVQSGTESDWQHARLLLLQQRTDRILQNRETLIKRTENALHRPSWRGLFNSTLPGSYKDPSRIEQELALVDKYIVELEQNPGQAMPVAFYENPNKLRDFIIYESKIITRAFSNRGAISNEAALEIERLVNHARDNQLAWIGYRSHVLKSLRHGHYSLERLNSLMIDRQKTQVKLTAIASSLKTGTIASEIDELFHSFAPREVEKFISETRATTLSEAMLSTLTREDIAVGRELVSMYRYIAQDKKSVIAKNFKILYPSNENLDQTIRKLTQEHDALFDVRLKSRVWFAIDFLTGFRNLKTTSPLFSEDMTEGKTLDKAVDFLGNRAEMAEALLFEESDLSKLEEIKQKRAIIVLKNEWVQKQSALESTRIAIRTARYQQAQLGKKTVSSMAALNLAMKKEAYEMIQRGEQPQPHEFTEPVEELPIPESVVVFEEPQEEIVQPTESVKITLSRFSHAVSEELARQILTTYEEVIKHRTTNPGAEIAMSNPAELFRRYENQIAHLSILAERSIPKGEIAEKVREAALWLLSTKTTQAQRKLLFTEYLSLQDEQSARLFARDDIITRGQRLYFQLQEFLARTSR